MQIDVHHAPGSRLRLLRERADRHDAGVVDHDVKRTELRLGLLEEALEAGRVGHVKRESDRAGTKLGCRPPGELGVDVANRDAGALCDQSSCGRATDAARAARDRDYLAGERSWGF